MKRVSETVLQRKVYESKSLMHHRSALRRRMDAAPRGLQVQCFMGCLGQGPPVPPSFPLSKYVEAGPSVRLCSVPTCGFMCRMSH